MVCAIFSLILISTCDFAASFNTFHFTTINIKKVFDVYFLCYMYTIYASQCQNVVSTVCRLILMSLFEILAASFDHFHLIAINIFLNPWKVLINLLPKIKCTILGWDCRKRMLMVLETMYKIMSYESTLKPCSYHKPLNARIWSLQFLE